MNGETQKAWSAFIDAANPGMLHPLNRRRLHKFVAIAYVKGDLDRLDHGNLHAEMAEHGFTEDVQDSVISTIEDAPGLFAAYEEVRKT